MNPPAPADSIAVLMRIGTSRNGRYLGRMPGALMPGAG